MEARGEIVCPGRKQKRRKSSIMKDGKDTDGSGGVDEEEVEFDLAKGFDPIVQRDSVNKSGGSPGRLFWKGWKMPT